MSYETQNLWKAQFIFINKIYENFGREIIGPYIHFSSFLCALEPPRCEVGPWPPSRRPRFPELSRVWVAAPLSHDVSRGGMAAPREGTWWRCCEHWTWVCEEHLLWDVLSSYLRQKQAVVSGSTLYLILQFTSLIVLIAFYCDYMFGLWLPHWPKGFSRSGRIFHINITYFPSTFIL